MPAGFTLLLSGGSRSPTPGLALPAGYHPTHSHCLVLFFPPASLSLGITPAASEGSSLSKPLSLPESVSHFTSLSLFRP
jgi:hypothetical protein